MAITVLAFDFGLKNIGVAYGQSLIGTTKALKPLKARDGIPDWKLIEGLLQEWKPEQLIVGLPLNMDDSESEMSHLARKFGHRLHGRFKLPVEMVDERLSTAEAKSFAREQGHKGNYKDSPVDSFAAEAILGFWLSTLKDQ